MMKELLTNKNGIQSKLLYSKYINGEIHICLSYIDFSMGIANKTRTYCCIFTDPTNINNSITISFKNKETAQHYYDSIVDTTIDDIYTEAVNYSKFHYMSNYDELTDEQIEFLKGVN